MIMHPQSFCIHKIRHEMWTWCLLCNLLGLKKGKWHNGPSVVHPITILVNEADCSSPVLYLFHGILYRCILRDSSGSSGAEINLKTQIFTVL